MLGVAWSSKYWHLTQKLTYKFLTLSCENLVWFQNDHCMGPLWYQADHSLDHIWSRPWSAWDHTTLWSRLWSTWYHTTLWSRLWSAWGHTTFIMADYDQSGIVWEGKPGMYVFWVLILSLVTATSGSLVMVRLYNVKVNPSVWRQGAPVCISQVEIFIQSSSGIKR